MTSVKRCALVVALLALPLAGCFSIEGGRGEFCRAEDAHAIDLRPDADRDEVRNVFQAHGWIVTNTSEIAPWSLAARKTWDDRIGLTATIQRASGYSGTADDKVNEIDHVMITIRASQSSASRHVPIARVADLEASLFAELSKMGVANDSTRTRPAPPVSHEWSCSHGD